MTSTPIISIAGRKLGKNNPCFIIAEAGVNHNGNINLALKLVDVAAECGADAIKFQTFHAESLVSGLAKKAEYQLQTTDQEESQLDMLRRLELNVKDHEKLLNYCNQLGIIFLSTPFEIKSANFLETLQIPAFKLSSGEITNLPFLAQIAAKGHPVILSTGMSTMDEVADAVQVIKKDGGSPLALLHCTSAYPAEPTEANLKAMIRMQKKFQVPVGFSDHTKGNEVAFAAVALGASIIEKHFTLDRSFPGPDQTSSLEPQELKKLVLGIRKVESSLGDGIKRLMPGEENTRDIARKSIFAATDIAAGVVLTNDMLETLRPGTGIYPSQIPKIIGKSTSQAIKKGTLFQWKFIE